jgi:hypothetical protein
MHAPDDAPTEKTRLASPLVCDSVYVTMATMAARSPLRVGLASKQLPPAVGAMIEKPY